MSFGILNLSEAFMVRVRIAPSPTGPLHIGTSRTALFNYLFAKKQKGNFILRIEDTDLERSNPKWERDILENLKWLKIKWDEGPTPIFQRKIGEITNHKTQNPENQRYIGDYGPYRQSQRIESYTKYIKKLLESGQAFWCYHSKEELEKEKKEQIKRKEAPRHVCDKRQATSDKKKKGIIRFRCPSKKLKVHDLIRGDLESDTGILGDISIAKDLKTPLYNFAVVVDDFEMKITPVIRGEDHLPNTPKQILIQEALGFSRPQYAHLPLILAPDKSKLSKRQGAVSIREYREQGYLLEALINFMALLGWNPGTDKEIFTLPELIKEFSLEKVQKQGAIFNIEKLDWFNSYYIRQKPLDELTWLCIPYLIEEGLIKPIFKIKQYPPAYGGMDLKQIYQISETKEEVNFEYLKKIISLYQERLKKLSEISELADFFFKEKLEYKKDLLSWKEMKDKEILEVLTKLEKIISKIKSDDWNKDNLEKVLLAEAESFDKLRTRKLDRGKLLWPLRVALTGKKASPGPFEIMEVLGKEKTVQRIDKAKSLFSTLDN